MLFDLRLLLVVIALAPALKTSISPEKKKKQEARKKQENKIKNNDPGLFVKVPFKCQM